MNKSFLVLFFKKGLLAFLLVATPTQAATLKISTWNLDWLTARSHAAANLPADVHVRAPEDFVRLAGYARKLNADIVAFQEVDGADAAALVFDPKRYTLLTIDEAVTQRVGLAVRRDIPVRRNPDYTALDVQPGAAFPLRDGLDATLSLPGGRNVRVLVVHLKTGCQAGSLAGSRRPACMLLARQVPLLAEWVAARQREGVAFLVMGDFNRVLDTPEEMGAALAQAAPLTRVTEGRANPCWEGDSFIDHILAGGPARGWLVPDSLRVQVFREDDERLKSHLSDHCPVSVTLDTGR
jgi:endonuclease/exonuclease/phosphatase family metal-dependent hydrolase